MIETWTLLLYAFCVLLALSVFVYLYHIKAMESRKRMEEILEAEWQQHMQDIFKDFQKNKEEGKF